MASPGLGDFREDVVTSVARFKGEREAGGLLRIGGGDGAEDAGVGSGLLLVGESARPIEGCFWVLSDPFFGNGAGEDVADDRVESLGALR
jgi:hypothetical protein